MTEQHTEIWIQPLVNWPRTVEAGHSYRITVDLRLTDPAAWPYDEEELVIGCTIDGRPTCRVLALGDAGVVLHRFGGSYGPAYFIAEIPDGQTDFTDAALWLTLTTAGGVPFYTGKLPMDGSSAFPEDDMAERAATKVGPEPRSEQGPSAPNSAVAGGFADTADTFQDLPERETAEPTLSQSSKAEISRQFWNRYRRYLENAQLMPPRAVHQLDEVTDRLLGMLEVPGRDGSWRCRGLVVAPAQSGTTSNYIALACKAVDAGYKLIVVLTANHNSLRKQTQIRVDEGLLGFDTRHPQRNDQERRYIGAGCLPGAPRLSVISLTTSEEDGDFRPAIAARMYFPTGDDPVVLVMKKNVRILQHVRRWIANFEGVKAADGREIVRSSPALVIDAEADNTSLNLASLDGDTQQSRVNMGIRHLLESFDKSAYVGYTVTPFTNSLVQPESDHGKHGAIFPTDFIMWLEAPSNYFGPERLFGLLPDDPGEDASDALPIVRLVTDYGLWMPDGHKKGWVPPSQLPGSLSEAISAFVLACAARQARGQVTDHKSMLIDATRFQDVQNRVADQVRRYLQLLEDRIRYHDSGSTAEDELHTLWERDFVDTSAAFSPSEAPPVTWGQVWDYVQPTIEKIQVQAVNGRAVSSLQYDEHRQEGLSVIAVGGSKLLPGLTLEGLTVSYYLQASKTLGTLLQQMGRSFGYRPGYEDLCRLYATPSLYDAWVEITVANDELRRDFEAAARDKGQTDTQ
jgi:Z1 domain